MKPYVLVGLLVASPFAAPAGGQGEFIDEQSPAAADVELELRVISARSGNGVIIDRGLRDALEVGDLVVFFPRDRASVEGRVRRVDERNALVELLRPGAELVAGARGLVHLPAERFAEEIVEETDAPDPEEVPEHPPWERTDEAWTPDLPLLAEVEAVRPDERPRRLSGRVYAIGDHLDGPSDYSDSFYRMGTDLLLENPFGNGGAFRFDGEINHRAYTAAGGVDESGGRFRLDRLSYLWGGTRFAPDRQEIGRFLQYGVPEFGVLDGYEWGTRLAGGDRFGASAGFMPEPNPEYRSGHDFQVAGWYEWVADPRERLSATGGFQKTFHDGQADRDLFLTKLRYSPEDGWDFNGSLWIDLYTSGDEAKGAGVEVTRAFLSTTRLWEDSGLSFTYVHQAFPEIDRFEFLPVTAEQLASSRNDRLAGDGWVWVGEDDRLLAGAGGWIDELDSGGDVELGWEHHRLFDDEDSIEFALFAVQARFSRLFGGRAAYIGYVKRARWELSYEAFDNFQDGFDAEDDETIHHRVRGDLSLFALGAWDFSLYGQGDFWNEESVTTLGFFLQRSF